MPAREGKRESVDDGLRLALEKARVDQGMTYGQVALAVADAYRRLAMAAPGTITALTIKRVLDRTDPQAVKSSTLVWAIRQVLGVREETDYRVTFNRDEIDVLDAYARLRLADKEAAARVLAVLKAQANEAEEIAQDEARIRARRERLGLMGSPAPDTTPAFTARENSTPAPKK